VSQFFTSWPKYWSFSISPSNEYSGLTASRIVWFDLLAVQGTLKSLLQHHSSKASILQCSAFFIVQRSHPYMTTGKTIALTRWTFVGRRGYTFFFFLRSHREMLVHKFQILCSVISLMCFLLLFSRESCPTLCDPMDCNMPGFPVLHSGSLLKLMSTELMMASKHLILCRPLLLLPSVFTSISSHICT